MPIIINGVVISSRKELEEISNNDGQRETSD